MLSAGIQVNERTGDYTLAYNDEAWIAASAAIAATWVTWGYDDGGTIGGKAGEAAIVDQHTLDPWKTAVIDAGAQIGAAGVQYDSSGNATGWSVGEMTTADFAGAGVSFGSAYLSSEVSQNMSSMEFEGDIWDNLGIGLRNQMVSSAINGAASGINQMIGSRNRMAHTLGGIAGSQLHAYQLRQEREALMNQQRSEAILLEQARKAAENGRTQEAAGILMGLGYREQAKKLLDGTYGKAIRQFTNKGNDAPMAIATLLAKEGKGNWPAIEARARELMRAGKSEVEALQQIAAESSIDLRDFGSSAHMSRIMGRDATHRAIVAQNTADQAYEQMSAVFDEVFSSQNQSAGQPRFIRDEVIGNWLHSVSPEWAEKARGLYGRSESVQGFDKRYSGKMYGAQDRLLQLPQDAGLPGWPGMRGRVHSDPENLLWEDISGGLNNGQYHGDFDHNLYLSKLRDYGAETVMPAIGLAPSDIGTFLNDRTMEIVEAAGDLSENPNARKELMRRLMKQGLSARKASSVLDAAGQLGKFTGFLNIAKTSAEFGWTMGEINGIQNDADRFRDEAYNMIVKREMNNLHRAFKQARSNVHSANSRLGWYSQDLLKLESRVNALTSTSATGESASVDVLRSLDLDRKYILDDIENAGHTIQTERARLVRINRAIKLLQNVRQAPPGQKFDQLQRYSAHLASNGYDGASHGYEVVSVAMEAELLRANTYGWNVQRMKGFGISAVPFPGASAMGSLYLWRNSAGIDFLKSIANYAEQKQKHQEYEYAY